MSTAVSSSCGSAGSDEVEVSGRGRGIRTIDLPAVFTTAEEREMLAIITTFDLSRNELVELKNLQPLRSLLRLNASYNHICRFDGLPLLLTQLNLAHNKLDHLDYLSQLTHLRELDVSFNRLTSLAGLTPRVPLEVLKADDNRIVRTIGLEGVQTLRVLSLSNNYIEDVDELLFLPTVPSLQLLRLAGNPITRVRRFRATVGRLQPALVSLDGAALVREEDLREPSRVSATRRQVSQNCDLKPQELEESDAEKRFFTHPSASAASTPLTSTTGATSNLLPAPQQPKQQWASKRLPGHEDAVEAFFLPSDASRENMRQWPSMNDLSVHRSAATQTVEASYEEADTAVPRADVPQPAARVDAATAVATTITTTTTTSPAKATTLSSSVRRDALSASGHKSLASCSNMAQAPLSTRRNTLQPPAATLRKSTATPSPRGSRKEIHIAQRRQEQESNGKTSASLRRAQNTDSPAFLQSLAEGDTNEVGDEEGEMEEEEAQGVDLTAVDEKTDTYHCVHLPATPGPVQRTSQMTYPNNNGSSSGRNHVGGYAALHATPSNCQISPHNSNSYSDSKATYNVNHGNVSGSVGTGTERRGRLGRLSSRSPASMQHSVTSQEFDATTAQLHDSLVAKEQLHRECQMLRQKMKHMEGQLTEARRVISQQLAELSQLRLERDALRQSEGEVMERLEKEKRVAKARAGHHTEEVQTLQSQYERMKTFYEAQLADTRRELSAERARLLGQQQQQRAKSRSNDTAVAAVDDDGEKDTEADVRKRKARERNVEAGTCATVTEKTRLTVNADAVAVTARASPPSKVAVPVSDSPPQPGRAPPHEAMPTTLKVAAVACNKALQKTEAEATPAVVFPMPGPSTDEVCLQLASWLYDSIRKTRGAATTNSQDVSEQQHPQQQQSVQGKESNTGCDQSLEYWKNVLESHTSSSSFSSTQQQQRQLSDGDEVSCNATTTAAARKLLEEFVAGHLDGFLNSHNGVEHDYTAKVEKAHIADDIAAVSRSSSFVELSSPPPSASASSLQLKTEVSAEPSSAPGNEVTTHAPIPAVAEQDVQGLKAGHTLQHKNTANESAAVESRHDFALPSPLTTSSQKQPLRQPLPLALPTPRLPSPSWRLDTATKDSMERSTAVEGGDGEAAVGDRHRSNSNIFISRTEDGAEQFANGKSPIAERNTRDDEEEEDTIVMSASPEAMTTFVTTVTGRNEPTTTRDQRVIAAKALLKGMEFMFED